MSNKMLSGNTINSENSIINLIQKGSLSGIQYLQRENKHIVVKSNKEKLLTKIDNEISTLSKRETLDLKYNMVTNNKGKTIKRYELRFWKQPNILNDTVDFMLKYKGRTVKFDESNNTFRCQNNVEVLVNELTNIRSVLSQLEEDNVFFKQMDKVNK